MKRLFIVILCLCFTLGGCMRAAPEATPSPRVSPMASPEASPAVSPEPSQDAAQAAKPAMPEGFAEGEEPALKVYVEETGVIEDMAIEQYLEGVLAGEMKNDWPIEALKAQAILARTYAMQFIKEKGGSKYEGAHVSTDITEAQAYDAEGINEAIKQAIDETRGMVLVSGGDFIFAWFHAHSGGLTAYAKEGLGFEDAEPPYTVSVKSEESDKAPEDAAQWEERFTKAEIKQACADIGVTVSDVNAVKVGSTGPSGRAETLVIGDTEVMAPGFRVALDSTRMRSTLLTSFRMEGDEVVMAGKGYGHGVGMSQWGAYGKAESGEKAEEIVKGYFKDVQVVTMW